MKFILISVGLLCSFFRLSTPVETTKENILTAHSWEMKTHSMSGIGSHKSIPKGATIEFLKDKIWKSSERIENAKTGKWSFENEGRTLVMTFDNVERKFLLQELTADKLRYQLRNAGATYTFEWAAKQ